MVDDKGEGNTVELPDDWWEAYLLDDVYGPIVRKFKKGGTVDGYKWRQGKLIRGTLLCVPEDLQVAVTQMLHEQHHVGRKRWSTFCGRKWFSTARQTLLNKWCGIVQHISHAILKEGGRMECARRYRAPVSSSSMCVSISSLCHLSTVGVTRLISA